MLNASTRRTSILAVLLLLPLTGCFFSKEIADTRRDIETAYPDLRLQKQVVLNLGPISLWTIGRMAGLAPDEDADMARRYLRDVSRIKVGIFKAFGSIEKLDFRQLGFEKEWEVAVKARQGDDRVWVLYREGEETVKDLYVVVLDDEDLVVARVHGKLERLLARVMEDHAEIGNRL